MSKLIVEDSEAKLPVTRWVAVEVTDETFGNMDLVCRQHIRNFISSYRGNFDWRGLKQIIESEIEAIDIEEWKVDKEKQAAKAKS